MEDLSCPTGGTCSMDFGLDLLPIPPPPPVPSFWNETSLWEPCSPMCHLFPESVVFDDIYSPKPLSADSIISVVCACVLGITMGFAMIMFIWVRKLNNRHVSIPPSLPSSPSETEYTCPVVNGKTHQSIILGPRSTSGYSNMHASSSSTFSPINSWTRGSGFAYDPVNRGLIPASSVLHPLNYEDHYAMRESCTSSPVYAELDGNGSLSPYAVGMVGDHRPDEFIQYNVRGGYFTQSQHN